MPTVFVRPCEYLFGEYQIAARMSSSVGKSPGPTLLNSDPFTASSPNPFESSNRSSNSFLSSALKRSGTPPGFVYVLNLRFNHRMAGELISQYSLVKPMSFLTSIPNGDSTLV